MSASHRRIGMLVALCAAALTTTPAAASPLPDAPLTVPTASAPGTPVTVKPLTSKVVTAPTDAVWTVDIPQVTAVVDLPPAPEPQPEPERQRPAAASRSAERPIPAGAAPTPEPAPATPPAVVDVSPAPSSVLDVAAQFVGVPYVSGGTTASGFDCSGFTQHVYAQLGISIPRTSGDQRYAGTVISRDQAQAGDLIWSPGHVAIYAGGNQQIDAPKPGATIQFRAIWQKSPVFIRLG